MGLFKGAKTGAGKGHAGANPGVRTAEDIKAAYGRPSTTKRCAALVICLAMHSKPPPAWPSQAHRASAECNKTRQVLPNRASQQLLAERRAAQVAEPFQAGTASYQVLRSSVCMLVNGLSRAMDMLKAQLSERGIRYTKRSLSEAHGLAYARRVEGLSGVMDENRARLAERGEKLRTLQDKMEAMSSDAEGFASMAKQLRDREANKKWWQM